MENTPKNIIRTAAQLAFAASLGWSTAAVSALQSFLDIPGVDGESNIGEYEKVIGVKTWSWGVVESGNGNEGCIRDLTIIKSVDTSSTYMLINAATQTPYDKATLFVVQETGEGLQEIATIDMEQVFVTSITTGASEGLNEVTENVVLQFDNADFTYKTYDDSGRLDREYKTIIVNSRGAQGCEGTIN